MVILRWLLGCVDPSDCDFFSDESCAPFLPSGVNCGLAHEGLDHHGGSCAHLDGVWYDPALQTPSSGIIDVRGQNRACPSEFNQVRLSDHEGGRDLWGTCNAIGNEDAVRRRLTDLPTGSVCGLSSLDGSSQSCEGLDPVVDGCPDGWHLRFVVDEYLDRTDEACHPTPGGTFKRGYDIVVFCELAEGCALGECPAGVAERGLLCGLHAEDWVNGTPRDLFGVLDVWQTQCPDDPSLSELPDLLAAAERPAQCLGVDVVADGCPGGLREVCTSDHIAECAAYGPEGSNVSRDALCWCADPDAAQALPTSIPTTDCESL